MSGARSISLISACAAVLTALVLGSALPARSQEAPTASAAGSATGSAAGPATRPVLEQLNRETQSLYHQVAEGIVRVQLPMRTDALSNLGQNPLEKWRLDAEAIRRIDQLQQRVPTGSYMRVEIDPATRPASRPVGQQPTGQQPVGQQPHLIVLTLSGFWPNSMGVVMDDKGHVMVPHYVDRQAAEEPIPVSLADGRLAIAMFVGSDKQTDLTVLQLKTVKPKAMDLSAVKPGDGSLVLVVSMNPAFNRLAVWTGAEPDLATIVSADGSIAGFTAGGRYRHAAACKVVAQELIEHGEVRRAFLGVVIEPVLPDDPQAMHDMPALRIMKVLPGSPAERAGLQAGDLIVKLAGESVGDAPAFAAAIAKSRGQTEMVLYRDGEQMKVDVDLQVR